MAVAYRNAFLFPSLPILQALTVRIITTVLARADCPAFLARVAIICTTTLPAIQFIATAK